MTTRRRPRAAAGKTLASSRLLFRLRPRRLLSTSAPMKQARATAWVALLGGLVATLAPTILVWLGPNNLCADEAESARPRGAAAERSHGDRKPNRLSKEKSPYLLQHAFNPVDWYPWGAEAFEKAVSENKPVFLSIGYATCHWCHVMERESFEDEEIAAFLNENFISIKVDREERPDVDGIYMDAVTALRQSGGWPLTVFLTPKRKPFFGGTYFPPRDHPQRGIGFLTVLQKIHEVWRDQRGLVEQQAEQLTAAVAAQSRSVRAAAPLKESMLLQAFTELKASFDPEHGGFRGPPRHAPKFPRTSVLDFLMRYAQLESALKDGTANDALEMVWTTLDRMIAGGIHDHLAGGFHRYSVDRLWLVPHFEKMLYDQALISMTLIDAARVSKNDLYLRAARRTLDYVLERMTGADGEIYSAEDADTNAIEGLTYVWTRAEVRELLGDERGTRFCEFYGVSEAGNFHEAGEGANVLHVEDAKKLTALVVVNADDAGGGDASLARELIADRAKLLAHRDHRPQPLRDDKVLTAWNGLAISALARTYQVSGETKYLAAAQRAAGFILKHLKSGDQLKRRFRLGDVKGRGFLNDYAFLAQGLIDLYESDFDARWLREALSLTQSMVRLFWDSASGAFFTTSLEHERLITRQQEFYDGAIPAGNSVAFTVLQRLAELTGDATLKEVSETMAKATGGLLDGGTSPVSSYPALLCGVDYAIRGGRQIVVVGDGTQHGTREMLQEVWRRFLPRKVLVQADSAQAAEALSAVVPTAEGKLAIGGVATAFVCKNGVCKLPARDLATLRSQLDAAGGGDASDGLQLERKKE